MKNSLSGFMTLIFAGLLMLVIPAQTFGDETFTLRLNSRLPQVPVARVKITLNLGAPINSDLTLTKVTVGTGMDAKTTDLDTGILTVTSGPNTHDRATFITLSPTEVVITYFPRSHFRDPTVWCQHKEAPMDTPVTYPVDIPITFQGPDVVSYRMNSYTVGKQFKDDEGDCSTARRRVKSAAAGAAAEINPSGATPLAATFLGRHPLDVILVLDKSGSMSSKPPANPASLMNKWEILKSSIQQFVSFWEQADPGPAGGGGTAAELTKDRIGVVFFSTNEERISFSGNDFVARGTNPPGPTHNWQAVADTLEPPRGPGGMTALGKGLNTAIDEWLDTPEAQRNDPTIVLMTDGIQNIDPQVKKFVDPATTIETDDMALLDLASVQKKLSGYFIPMLTIDLTTTAAGTTSDTYLEAISRQTAGTPRMAADFAAVSMSYHSALIELLKGNTLSTLLQSTNTLAAVSDASAPTSVLLDGSVRRATVILGWEGGAQSPGLDLEISAPGGGKVTPSIRQDGINWTIQSVDIPATGPDGNWNVKVVRKPVSVITFLPHSPHTDDFVPDNTPASSDLEHPLPEAGVMQQSKPAIPYHLSVYAADGKLDYRISFNNLNNGTGDTMTLMADVSYEGKSLAGLSNTAITLKIDRPATGLGTILHDTPVEPKVLSTEIAGAGDVTSPYDRKVAALAAEGKLESGIPLELGTDFILRDNGSSSNGDQAANDGVYSARFADTSRPSLYRFKVILDWDDPRTGKIRRTETIERIVKVTPDSKASKVNVNSQGGGVVVISVTPLDKFNNYLGPSSVNPITVKLTGGGNVTSITDPNQTGDYLIRIENVPSGADPHVVIAVDGRTIRDANISQLSDPDPGFKRWGLSLHAGVSIPHGNFSNIFDPGPNFAVDLEYRFHPLFSIEGIYGFHRFNGTTIGGFTFSDVNMHQFSLNGKVYGNTSPVRPFFNFGGGAYHITPSTRGGLNVGGGLQFEVNPSFAVEGSYNFHNIFTSGSNTRFSTVQAGVRFRF